VIALLFALMSTAIAQDHSGWQAVLDTYRRPNARVDYAGIQRDGALDSHIAALATASVPSVPREEMAFWINAYNAITVELVASSWPIRSIKDLDGGAVWTQRRFTVAGQQLTLDQMEKDKLTKRFGPRIHFALNCASLGCPPLSAQAYAAPTLDTQLHTSASAWLSTAGAALDREKKTLRISSIFDWYAADFADDGSAEIPGVDGRLQGPLKFIAKHLPEADGRWISQGNYTVQFTAYDWRINAP